jgi:hypothetical protein
LDVAAGAVYLITGIGLGWFTSGAVTVMSKALGIGLAVLGLTVMIRASRKRRSSINWAFDVVRGAIYVAADVSVVVTGEGDLPDVGLLEESLEDAFGTDVHVTVEYFPSQLVTSDNQ